MSKLLRLISLIVGGILMFGFTSAKAAEPQKGSAYDYSFTTLIGEKPLPLSQFKGKVILIVNTASQCGFTKQYSGLQKLYDDYHDKGLVILGVPSNDFGGQEPGSNKEIKKFCEMNFAINYDFGTVVAHYAYNGAGGSANQRLYANSREMPIPTNAIGAIVDVTGIEAASFYVP